MQESLSHRLAELIESLADTERKIEIVREVMAVHQNFYPHAVFRLLDTGGKGHLDSKDFHTFATYPLPCLFGRRKKGLELTERECHFILTRQQPVGSSTFTYERWCS